MKKIWYAINDDKLENVKRTVDFLQTEFSTNGADPMWTSEYFHWKLGESNPAGKGYITLAIFDDQVVGTVSMTRKRLFVGGKECIGAEVGDCYSSACMRRNGVPSEMCVGVRDNKNYINTSIFGRLAYLTRMRAENDGIQLIYGTPNRNAYPGMIKRLNYFELDRGGLRGFVRPTTRLVLTMYPKISSVGSILKNLERICTKLIKESLTLTCRKRFSFERGIASTDEINALWEEVKNEKIFSLVRDGNYWAHRYLKCPLAKYELFTIREAGELKGLVVTRLLKAENGRCQLAVVEWMINHKISLSWVLAEILDIFSKNDIDYYRICLSIKAHKVKAVALNLFLKSQKISLVMADTEDARQLELSGLKTDLYLGSTDIV